ncbi:protein CLAVATA 3 [Lycium ferocissimum]|uniref:protein CLAVATA 3 n=1 Tax=Lycium ferocissimum TaxID=112874 RepID=UPI00281667EA|nr:protein CLAVATA 3 [Lycium ferocissimum]
MSLITAKHFTLLVLLCFLVIQESHGCTSSSSKCILKKEVASMRLLNRKVFGSQWAALGKGYYNHAEKINEKFADWELRGVPAGPDPVHHNGASPKKPRTP